MISLLILCTALPWYEQKMEGWYYFQDQDREEKLSPEEAEEILSAEKEYLKELLSLAVLVPTKENVANYIREQKRWSDQSSLFANTWIEVLSEPKTKALVDSLSNSFFLLFCFNGSDTTSLNAAKTAQDFSTVHHWILKSVSLDGLKLEGIDSEEDHGISKRLKEENPPAFYIVNPSENQILYVGNGHFSLSDLEKKILQIWIEQTDA